MKKLLSLLSILTIIETAVPTTIAASHYQKEEELNSDINYSKTNNLKKLIRNKREINNKNKIDISLKIKNSEWLWKNEGTFIILIAPNFWEELNQLLLQSKIKSNISFINLQTFHYSIFQFYDFLVTMIKNNLSKINKIWEQSDKNYRLIIHNNDYSNILSINNKNYAKKFKYNNVKILNNENTLYNKYLDTLLNDFNNEINVSIIENDNNDFIIERIKKKYKDLDIYQFEFKEIINYLHFIQGYFTKNKVKNNSEKYSKEILKPKFIFNNKEKIKELSDKIKNNLLVKQWLENIKDYNKNLPTKIETKILNKIDENILFLNYSNILSFISDRAIITVLSKTSIIPVVGIIVRAIFSVIDGSCAIENA